MSRKVFEYFFDPEDLEPFYSELPKSFIESSARLNRDVAKRQQRAENTANPDRCDSSNATTLPTAIASGKPGTGEETMEEPSREDHAAGASAAADRVTEIDVPLDTSDAPKSLPASAELRRTRVRRLHSVHALGQYVFCHRSAILAAEKGDQRDVDEEMPRFTYLPNFDREKIEEKLSAKITQLGFFALYGVCLLVLMKMGIAEQKRWVFYPSLIAFLGLSFWSLNVLVCIVELAIRRRAAIRAEAREPEPDVAEIQRVNWWSMLKAGYEPMNYERAFQHPELPLEGSPWRVLQRGSRRIPVIKSGSRKLGEGKGQLYPKHQVRLVAYALLLEAAGHIEVPYGLVFPVDSPHGLAFPISDELRARTVRLLDGFEQKLVDSQQRHIQPQLPENRNRCTNCDYGKPAPTSAREVEQARKAAQQLIVLRGRTGDLYRCDCGDRFGSAPPHGLTVRKGLTAVVN